VKNWTTFDWLLAAVVVVLLLQGSGSMQGCGGGGATQFYIVRESLNDSNQFASVLADLRSGPVADELKANGYQLVVLDDDAKNQDGQPVPQLVKFGVYSKIDNDRRILLYTKPPDTLVGQEDLPPDVTADSVLAAIKARGK
jgi:hypothetical protein